MLQSCCSMKQKDDGKENMKRMKKIFRKPEFRIIRLDDMEEQKKKRYLAVIRRLRKERKS